MTERRSEATSTGRTTTVSQAVGAIALLAVLAYATLEKGAFFAPASEVVLGASLCLVASAVLGGRHGRAHAEDVALLALAAWWWLSAELHHTTSTFLPFGASAVALCAAAACTRALRPPWRRGVATAAVTMAALVAVSGLLACDLRWYPVAIRGQDLWRLAGTLTYSNATGLLLAIALVLAVGLGLRAPWHSLLVASTTAGLVATQSRGAVLACLVGACFLSRRELAAAAGAAACGALAGLLTVATSSGNSARPWVIPLSVALLAVAPVAARLLGLKGTSGAGVARVARVARWVLALGAVAVVCALGVAAAHEIAARVDTGSLTARLHEWRSALDQFGSSPLDGVGPDATVTGPSGIAYFAHNEYLQVLAGSGLVGAALLVSAIVAAAGCREVRTAPRWSRAPLGALAAFSVGGLYDFSWHVPAVAALAGVALGLAHRVGGHDADGGLGAIPGQA